MKSKLISATLILLMVASLFTGCGKKPATDQKPAGDTASSADFDPKSKYATPVELTVGRDNPVNVGYPEGDTVEKNQFIKAVKDRYNIDIKYSWLVASADYNAKVNLAIASGDIPDVMVVNQQSQVNQLVDAGMTADVLDAYNKTASPLIKQRYDSFGDKKFTTGMFNGKLLALPNTNIGYQFNLLWIRKDWLDKVGAQPPKTLDDVINLAKTFIQKDPGGNGAGKTIGITGNSSVAGNYNTKHTFEPIFSAYNSFPRQWVQDASGNYSYGTIASETKTALAKVAEMYKAGLIDPGFATAKVDDEDALIASGKVGMMFGPWYMGNRPLSNSIKNDPNAEWIAVQAPLDSNGIRKVPVENPHGAWLVVKKGYEHPEAVMKVLNLQLDWFRKADSTLVSTVYPGLNIGSGAAPIPFSIEFENIIVKMYGELKAALDSKDPSKLDTEEKLYYDNYMADKANPKKDATAWANATSRFTGQGAASLPVQLAKLGFPSTTKTMETKWANLQKLEDETMLKIVLGQVPVDYFDTFVTQWKQQGGDEITKEVNDQLKAQK